MSEPVPNPRKRANEVSVGDRLGPLAVWLTREDLVRYAGASLDFNPIHYNERVATSVGLPNVVAHGMLTMALAGRLVTDWAGDPGAVVEYGVRFTRPVVVPNDDKGAEVEFTGTVAALAADEHGTIAKITIVAKHGGKTVLGSAVALVRLCP